MAPFIKLTPEGRQGLIKLCETWTMWDAKVNKWKSDDGTWLTLSPVCLKDLERKLKIFNMQAKDGADRQYIITERVMSYINEIIETPDWSLGFNHNEILTEAWELMYNLTFDNTTTAASIWKKCEKILIHYLLQGARYSTLCRMVVYNLVLANQVNGLIILKIILNRYRTEKDSPGESVSKQALAMLLEYFVAKAVDIQCLCLQLEVDEKLNLLHFASDHLARCASGSNLPLLSLDFLLFVFNDFNSKCYHALQNSYDNITFHQEMFALFEVIAAASKQTEYNLKDYDFELAKDVGLLLNYYGTNEEDAQKTFLSIKRNAQQSLKFMLLETLEILVKDNANHREEVRKSGLIDILVDFMAAKGSDPYVRVLTVRVLEFICVPNQCNREYVQKLVTKKDPNNQCELFRKMLRDLQWAYTENLPKK